MESVVFEDDMREFRNKATGFLCIAFIAVMAYCALVIRFYQNTKYLRTIIVLGIIFAVLLIYAIYLLIYVCKYHVSISNQTLTISLPLFKKTFVLVKGIRFTIKPIAGNYFLFNICFETKHVKIRTKKREELINILNTYA